jgi:tryptophan-rich hypothetical protein
MSHKINPRKLLNSKWTAAVPKSKEKHFIVTAVDFDEEGRVIECVLEAIMNKRLQSIDWRDLKDAACWQMGWK